MRRIVLMNNNAGATIADVRRDDLIGLAGCTIAIYCYNLVVVSLTRVVCGYVVEVPARLRPCYSSTQGFRVTRCASQNLITSDRRVAGVCLGPGQMHDGTRSEEHTSELQSRF